MSTINRLRFSSNNVLFGANLGLRNGGHECVAFGVRASTNIMLIRTQCGTRMPFVCEVRR